MRNWIKKERKKRGLSQETLAENLSWSLDKISRIERGKQTLTIEEAGEIGKAMGLSEEEMGNVVLKEMRLKIKFHNIMSITREKKRFPIEVHVGSICLRKTGWGFEILIGKRLPSRELYEGKWDCGGGQVRPGENFEEAIKRQVEEEFGVKVNVIDIIGTYEIKTSRIHQEKIPGIKFLCEFKGYINNKTIKCNRKEYSECKWIKEREVFYTDLIKEIKKNKDIEKAIDIYKRKI